MPLSGYRVLIVEDDALIAEHICAVLADAGCAIVGPFASNVAALEGLNNLNGIDAAVLDVNLDEDASFPLALALRTTQIPFMFLTGCERHELPEQFESTVHMKKPFVPSALVSAVAEHAARS